MQMMPPGPSPESGLAGVWRVIGAQPAPWARPRRLTKADAPLLEFAVEFRDGEVKGPPPLACRNARYSSGVTYIDGLFGGKLAGDRDGKMTAAVHLSRGSPTTFRVICGNVSRDYYIDDNADMVMAEGDVIYTLQRPTGMDPEQYKAGFSGPSFDCTEAKTAVEQLICIDAQLSKSDTKVGGGLPASAKRGNRRELCDRSGGAARVARLCAQSLRRQHKNARRPRRQKQASGMSDRQLSGPGGPSRQP